tara:strand:- start:81 stop:224 length:144 start_codon:yes stop_codon:yes gene_type:complete
MVRSLAVLITDVSRFVKKPVNTEFKRPEETSLAEVFLCAETEFLPEW